MTDESILTEGEQANTETPAVSGTEGQPEAPKTEGTEAEQEAAKAAEGEEKKGEGEEEAQGAPEKYEWDLGEGVEVSEELAGEFEPIARELNLTNDQANKLASEMLPKVQKQMSDQWAKQVDEWRQQAESDEEFGGAKLEGTMKEARKALDHHGSKELTELLDQTGIGNHPALIRAFASMGRSLKEDQLVSGEKAGQEQPREERWYGKE